MPPSFQNCQAICFYRPCWNSHERGPPVDQRKRYFAAWGENKTLLSQSFNRYFLFLNFDFCSLIFAINLTFSSSASVRCSKQYSRLGCLLPGPACCLGRHKVPQIHLSVGGYKKKGCVDVFAENFPGSHSEDSSYSTGVHSRKVKPYEMASLMAAASFSGSSVPMRILFPLLNRSSTASSPSMLYSHPRTYQRIPQPHHQPFRTCRQSAMSASGYVFQNTPGPNRIRTVCSLSVTVRLDIIKITTPPRSGTKARAIFSESRSCRLAASISKDTMTIEKRAIAK